VDESTTRTLPELRHQLLARPTRALVVVPREVSFPGAATGRVLREHFPDATRHNQSSAHYPNGSTVRVVEAPFRPIAVAGSFVDIAIVLAPLSAAELYEVRARLFRTGGELVAPLAPAESGEVSP
jgi:hypothetical protein